MIKKLLIGITVHFVKERIEFLRRIAINFNAFSLNTKVFVVTNTSSSNEQKLIKAAIQSPVEIYVPKHLGHPYLLTWSHLDIFRKYFQTDSDISHFMYLEDDIEIKPNNIEYWLRGRDNLRKAGLIPSFLRYEFASQETEMRSVDLTSSYELKKLPVFQKIGSNYCYINLPRLYQGMYLLDRELAKEHLFGKSSHPDFNRLLGQGMRERACQGLTFKNVAPGNFSRNFLGFMQDKNLIDPDALIHHTTNTYANDPKSKFGKIKIKDLII
jgi:hypothetical protein